MSTCVFCGQPIGADGSMRLYYLEDNGGEGYACARCEEQLQGRQTLGPAGSDSAMTAPAPRFRRTATNPLPASPLERSYAFSASDGRGSSGVLSQASSQAGRQDPAQARGPISRLLDSPPPKPDVNPHSPWIVGMKIFAWLLCGATVAGVCLWGSQASFLQDYFQSTALFLAVLIPTAVLGGLVVVGFLMIFLNLAQDVRLIRIRMCQREEER